MFAIETYGPSNAEITLVVTDPLALPLACSCVQGYAQRKYEKLADFLQSKLGKSVRVVWGESIEGAKKEHGLGLKTVFIGKDSVVRFDSKKLKMDVTPLSRSYHNDSPPKRNMKIANQFYLSIRDGDAATATIFSF